MPRRYHGYTDEFQVLDVMSTAGIDLSASVVSYTAYLAPVNLGIVDTDRERQPILRGATGLEWQTPSPPPTENFDTTPVVSCGPYIYTMQEAEVV